MRLKRVCVFCGTRVGERPAYAQATQAMARELVRRRIGVIFGGGGVGLMGVLADETLRSGGDIVGVIPQALVDREEAHPSVGDLRVVETMHERKQLMSDLADAFIALPGGFGTLEEVVEAVTWTQIGIHHKPCGVLDVESYWTPLQDLIVNAAAEGFIDDSGRRLLVFEEDCGALLDRLESWPSS